MLFKASFILWRNPSAPDNCALGSGFVNSGLLGFGVTGVVVTVSAVCPTLLLIESNSNFLEYSCNSLKKSEVKSSNCLFPANFLPIHVFLDWKFSFPLASAEDRAW